VFVSVHLNKLITTKSANTIKGLFAKAAAYNVAIAA